MNKDKIDSLIDIWLDTVSRTEVGWPKESMLAKFMMYRGSFQDTKRYFRGLNANNKTFTNKDRASKIGQRLRQYENNVSKAYTAISKTLELLEKRQKIS